MSDSDGDTIEGDWRFMGGLDPEDASMMRRVSAKIVSHSSPELA